MYIIKDPLLAIYQHKHSLETPNPTGEERRDNKKNVKT